MDHPYQYIGCFPDPAAFYAQAEHLRSRKLFRQIQYPHVTVLYRPEDPCEALFGTQVEVRVTGYGCDGENEGFLVALFCEDPGLQAMLDRIPVPHITLSVSQSGKPVNTHRLEFHPVEPFTIHASFGGFVENKGPVVTK